MAIATLVDIKTDTLKVRVRSLDAMPDRGKLTVPQLRPSSFEFGTGAGDGHKVHHSGDREGLEHGVIGSVEGLGRDTGQRVAITFDPRPIYHGVRAMFTLRIP